mmetsp:Transcript_21548/g.43207  ORF Transcript_21548/g.43207 Transcript_21548/m.43207 type:complete len:247 (-) Transcript_21548:62-802(-)
MHFSFPHIKRSKLPLYLFEEDWAAALAEIECHPREAKHWEFRAGFFDGEHESSVLPLHVACSLHTPLHVVKAIVEAYPEALRMNESAFKRLPIHVACQFAERPEVIKYLVEEDRATALEPDVLGRLPIHYACSNGSDPTVIKTLLAANPASALYADYNGWLPIHVAINFGASTKVIEELVKACPASVAVQTMKGSTTVSLAEKVSTKNKADILKVLKDAVASGKCEGRHTSKFGNTSHVMQISRAA